MRKTVVTIVLAAGFGIYLNAQSSPASRLTLSFSADTSFMQPEFGYDGVIRPGPANNVSTFTGNVVIRINDITITTDKASWHMRSNVIEFTNGRIELPRAPTAFSIRKN